MSEVPLKGQVRGEGLKVMRCGVAVLEDRPSCSHRVQFLISEVTLQTSNCNSSASDLRVQGPGFRGQV
jgi:hypothetical protein